MLGMYRECQKKRRRAISNLSFDVRTAGFLRLSAARYKANLRCFKARLCCRSVDCADRGDLRRNYFNSNLLFKMVSTKVTPSDASYRGEYTIPGIPRSCHLLRSAVFAVFLSSREPLLENSGP
jgi:hypothetical protein